MWKFPHRSASNVATRRCRVCGRFSSCSSCNYGIPKCQIKLTLSGCSRYHGPPHFVKISLGWLMVAVHTMYMTQFTFFMQCFNKLRWGGNLKGFQIEKFAFSRSQWFYQFNGDDDYLFTELFWSSIKNLFLRLFFIRFTFSAALVFMAFCVCNFTKREKRTTK